MDLHEAKVQAGNQNPEGTPENTVRCLNCGHQVFSTYCTNCGQKADTPRTLRLWPFLLSGLHAVQEFDQSIVHTLKQLPLRPGIIAREYIAGHRVRYWHPVKAVLTLTSVCLILVGLFIGSEGFQKNIDQNMAKTLAAKKISEKEKKAIDETMHMVSEVISHWKDWAAPMLIMVIPFMMVSSKLFWRKRTHTWGEALVFNAYYTVSSLFWLIVILPLLTLPEPYDDWVMNVYIVFSIGLLALAYKDFYQDGWGKTVVKTALSTIFFTFLYYLVFIVIIVVGVMLWIMHLKGSLGVTPVDTSFE